MKLSKKFTKLTTLSLLLATSLGYVAQSTAAQSTAEEAKLSVATTEVVPGIYMLSGVNGFLGGNMGLSIGKDGVILIDDALSSNLDLVKAGIKKVTDQPIDYLINTHVHGDHIGNNAPFGLQGTQIVAHQNLRQRLLQQGASVEEDQRPAKAALPVITFDHAMNFHLNGNDAHIFHVANAHTDGDVVIHFKPANVIHTGDTMFNGHFPYIDFSRGGSLKGYIAAQKKIFSLANEQTRIIPGHGPLASKADLAASIAMLEEAKKRVGALMSSGKSEDQIVAINPLADYHEQWNWGFITTEKMTRQVYQGLK